MKQAFFFAWEVFDRSRQYHKRWRMLNACLAEERGSDYLTYTPVRRLRSFGYPLGRPRTSVVDITPI